MDIKLIAIDLDDTLLSDDLTIAPRDAAAVRAATERGIKVVLASGRMWRSVERYYRQLSLDTPIIACNGATVYGGPGGAVLYHRPIPVDTALAVNAFAGERGWYIQAYVGDIYVFERPCAFSDYYASTAGVGGRAVGPLAAYLSEPPHKMLFIDDENNIPGIYDAMRAQFGGALSVAVSKPMYVELTHVDAHKGAALSAVLDALGIPAQNAMAIGDSLNDIPMLRVAGTGCAMGNARDEVKRAAAFVTGTNNECGVAQAIERVL